MAKNYHIKIISDNQSFERYFLQKMQVRLKICVIRNGIPNSAKI